MPTDKEISEMLKFTVAVIEEAGGIAMQYFRSGVAVDSKSQRHFDPVTEADRGIESFLRGKIAARYPDHSIVGEEHGISQGNHMQWFIDPIDGTRGFISGSPLWGSLIGVMENETCLFGVVHQPFLKETFYGSAAGAFMKTAAGTRPMATRETTEVDEAILYCTHPAMFGSRSDRAAFGRVEAASQFSRFGSDCYGYCLLAAGFADLVVEGGLKSYDIVPHIPIIEAAGGVVTDWEGGPAYQGGRVVAAATPELHEKTLKLLEG